MRISELKGIGDKTEKLFERLGINTVNDLLTYYPRTYDVYEEPVYVTDMKEERVYAVSGIVAGSCELNTKGRFKIVSVMVADEMGNRIKMTWFNMPFLKNQLKRGYRCIFRGRVAFRGNLVFMEQPAMYAYDAYIQKLNSMQPIYRLTAGLTNNAVTKAVKQCFDIKVPVKEFLPESIIRENSLKERKAAIYSIHFPKDRDELAEARKRLAFDEFFLFTVAVRSLRTANLVINNEYVINESEYAVKVLQNLGYELTGAQKNVYKEILSDMSGTRSMNRLVQGDVGSGKTILAFIAMINACARGFQSAMMAPTEVLARQHYDAMCNLIEKNGLPFKCVLLTGSLSAKDKKQAQEAVMSHEADIVIGTHAVITEKVEFDNLALVITDEQHRFGVKQRESLSKKGNNPHILVMSATPIPRSLAIILYGDLDISILDEKPIGRLPIKNCVVDDSYHPNAYRFITNEINRGHQAYIICAMAEESDNDEIENVVEYTEKLRKEFPSEVRIEYLHGKMKSSEKNRIMQEFADGDIKILVSTTVVEVGINVPNATVMMIENADRFGLATLHQLRGRVGRGADQSYCILVSNSRNEATRERLMILKDSNDGFYISEQDLKLRGPGDMLGVRQSGDFGFDIGDVYADATTLKLASDTAAKLLESNPTLEGEELHNLRNRITEYMNERTDRINL